MLKIKSLTVGPFQSNCYLVQNEDSLETVVIDPGDEAERILATIAEMKGRVKAIWNTHGHIDHINGNAGVKAKHDVPITIHALEAECLESPIMSGAALFGLPFHPSKADHTWRGGEEFEALERRWKVHHTPGHSPGSCVIVCEDENVAFGGDLLFAGSVGRTDLPGGSSSAMTRSLCGLFNDWGRDSWKIYAGHGPATRLSEERIHNFFVREALEHGLD